MSKPLILGSTSPFRKELMQKLHIPFLTDSPDIDETRLEGETPEDMVKRLSVGKAKKVAENHPHSLIIGSDQCAVLEGEVMGKPGNHENAVAQLEKSSGKRVTFYTGLCLLDSETNKYQLDCIPFYVDFRTLSADEINHYLYIDKPYNCAGSFKSEGLGITLFNKMQGDDPSSLIGLPLIRLCEMLRKHEVKLPPDAEPAE
ncbi:MAG TPA: septum formation inhibitor Maf [Thiothrix sp.]|nr:septum formation inhibitor Maf [Thiothrix sp.]